jgi:hypothetical protein
MDPVSAFTGASGTSKSARSLKIRRQVMNESKLKILRVLDNPKLTTGEKADVPATMNCEYHRAAVHRFENGTRLKDMTPEQVGAAGVPS